MRLHLGLIFFNLPLIALFLIENYFIKFYESCKTFNLEIITVNESIESSNTNSYQPGGPPRV